MEKELLELKEKLKKSGIDISSTSIDDIIYNFEDSLDKDYKREHGIVYTPQWVSDAMVWKALNLYLRKKTGYTWDRAIELLDNNGKDTIIKMLWDESLRIRWCEPSVGAGVFIFSIIRIYMHMYCCVGNSSEIYQSELKVILGLLENNIYAIELDSNAVDITNFRLWAYCTRLGYNKSLSEFKTNIYVGDSINHSFEGLNIEYDYELTGVSDVLREEYIEDWQLNWRKYVHSSLDKEKYKAKANLINIALEISSILSGKSITYKCDSRIVKNKSQFKAFNWQLEFSTVFSKNQEKIGFDIIIGNPPYVRNTDTSENISDVLGNTANLYMYFMELANTRGTPDCITSMIVPNNWFSAAYAKDFRKVYTCQIESIIDFNMHYVFKGVFIATAIITLDKSKNGNSIEYSNVEFIMDEHNENNLLSEARDKKVIVDISNLEIERKYIFGEPELYAILNKLKQLPTLSSQYSSHVEKGIVVDISDRCEPGDNTQYLAKGEDVLTFGVLTSTKLATRHKMQKSYKNYLIIPEVTRNIRCCKLGDVIPLDSTVYIENTHRNLIALLNSEIFNLIYSILISTNFMISYAEVRFPRKNKLLETTPVPKSLDMLDRLRMETNDWTRVSKEQTKQLNKLVQELYDLTEYELEILRRYNI